MNRRRFLRAALLAASSGLSPRIGRTQAPPAPPVFPPPSGATSGATSGVMRMHEGRWASTATLLYDERVLIAGGYSFAKKDTLSSCEIFNPRTGVFTVCAPLSFDRNFACASFLWGSDNKVIVMGGFSETQGTRGSAEIYDPKSDTWEAAAPMNEMRELFTCSPVPGGRSLLAGGLSLEKRRTLRACEIYIPELHRFIPTRFPMHNDRFGHAQASLPGGEVLVVGGQSWTIGKPSQTLATAEVFDPHTQTWQLVGPPRFARDRPTATVLTDERVLIAGGTNKGDPPLPAEIYDPKTRRFTIAAPLREGRMAHAAVRLHDDRVLVAGGWSDSRKATTPTVELYDAEKNTWETAPNLPFSAHDLHLLLFKNGRVLAIGGKSTQNDDKTAVSVDRAVWVDFPKYE